MNVVLNYRRRGLAGVVRRGPPQSVVAARYSRVAAIPTFDGAGTGARIYDSQPVRSPLGALACVCRDRRPVQRGSTRPLDDRGRQRVNQSQLNKAMRQGFLLQVLCSESLTEFSPSQNITGIKDPDVGSNGIDDFDDQIETVDDDSQRSHRQKDRNAQ